MIASTGPRTSLASMDQLKSRPAPLMGTLAAIALCVVVPLVIVASTDSASPNPSWGWALLATAIAGARFSWIVASASRRLYEMTTWLFFYLFMGLAPMVQLRQQVDPGTTQNLLHEFDEAAFAIIIASQLLLMVGSHLGKLSTPDDPSPARRVVNASRTRWVSLFILAGAAAVAVNLGPGLFGSRAQRNGAVNALIGDEALRALVVGFVTLGLLTAVVAQFEVRRQRKAIGSTAPLLLLAVSTILLLVIVNPLSSPRFLLMTVVLGLLAAAGLYRTASAFRAVAVSAVLGMLVLFPVLDSFRGRVGAVQAVDPLGALKESDFDAFGQLLNTITYVEAHDITWGNQFLGVLLFWVPRSIWPGKPIDTGILLAEDRGYWFTNISAPLPAELYINGGWVALVAGMLAIGFFLRRWDDRNEMKLRILGVPTILGCVIPFYLVLLFRGSMLQAAANLGVILFVWFLVTSRSKQPVGDLPAPRGVSLSRSQIPTTSRWSRADRRMLAGD